MSTAKSAPGMLRPSWGRYQVLAFLCAAAAIAYVQRNGLATAESTIREELGLSKHQMGLVLSSFFVAYAVFQIPTGWLGDRWGSRRALPLYSMGWSAATALTACAGTFVTLRVAGWTEFEGVGLFVAWQWFLISRFLAGAAQAGIFPCAALIIAEWFPGTRRAVASGWLAGAQQVGGILAAFLTALLLPICGWRWLFVAFAVPGILWAIWFWSWFRDRPADHLGVNSAELALLAGKHPRVASQSGPREGTPWLALAASPAMWLICGQQFCRAFGYIFYGSWFPTYLQETRGITVMRSGLLGSLPVIATLLAAPVGGAVSDWVLQRTGRRRRARAGLSVGFLLASAGLIFAAYPIRDPISAVLLISAGSFFAGMAGTISYATTIEMAGRHVATVFATMNMSGNVGAALFPVIVPWLLAWSSTPASSTPATPNWDLVLFVFGGVYLVAAGCWVLLNPEGTFVQQPDDSNTT